jgi:hypothetical protein
MFEISVATILVAVNVAIFVWFRRSKAAASARRMMRMMVRVGLVPGIVAHRDPQTEAIMKETRRRCGRCRLEDFCDRWLAGKAEGGSAFCPNAETFRMLTRTSGPTSIG